MELKTYIKQRGISVKKAAQELEITRGYLYEIVGKRISPGRKTAIKIQDWSQNLVKFVDLWEDNGNRK
uniref:Putative DNA binding, helix-turn-helix domain containing protein n=1 Tax=viral metagenome TaxID=1070528 RepID=A0A6M3K1T4_9ZZZZ